MSSKDAARDVVIPHGARRLPAVVVEAYNAELRDGDGFLGDRASKRAFGAMLDHWRDRTRRVGDDPLGDKPTEELSRKKLDRVLAEGDPEAAGVVHGAIEDFATELANVIARLLKLKGWKGTERIVVGGGLRGSRIGELVIGRASVLLKADGHPLELRPIHHDPDEAALVGAVRLAPPWMFSGHEAILAVDIGGSNVRAGLVELRLKEADDFSHVTVRDTELWCYADEASKPSRTAVLDRLGEMLERFVRVAAKAQLGLAPFVGVGCPGIIADDGAIERGGQNLPGNWESNRFNLPAEIVKRLPKIGDHETVVVLHNDAVVQGLSELPFLQDVEHWGVLTIGTGLGNAAFTNRRDDAEG